jgi:hypothetical protein
MKIWAWTLDDWNIAFQVATLIFVAGTVVTGAITVFVSKEVSRRQAEALQKLEQGNLTLQRDARSPRREGTEIKQVGVTVGLSFP